MSRRLRIAFALPGLHRVVRGAETAFEQIAARLAILGHEVTVFGSGPPRSGQPYRYIRIPCVHREFFENWPKFPGLRSHYAWEELTFSAGLMLRYRPAEFDVTVGCSYPYVNWILRRGLGEYPKHVFVTENGDWMVENRSAEYRFFDCDGLVCTNPQYFAKHSERYFSALIPNGVDPDVFSPGAKNREAYGLQADGPVALMVSALIESKRVIEGVRAAAKIPGLFLVIAGDGECREQVDDEARRLLAGRYRRVSLPRDRMPGLYRCADVFLHMSRDEASANAYMEALATGLPIVTHDWEVTRWTLEDCGYLVDCADEQAVIAAISRAMDDQSAENVSRRRELVQRRFAWAGIAEQYSSFLQQLCDASYSPASANSSDQPLDDVGVVVIGRNEGQRLVRCLESVKGKTAAVVYVDSASKDQSVANARRLGAEVVELDASAPFNAARARNEGVERLKDIAPDVEYVQFLDGDCELRPSWLARARQAFDADMAIAAVCGRRRERFPHRSIYNRMMDMEWNTPVGPAKSVGGDAMFRLEPFSSARGFDRTVMAGEEPQLCLRLRHAEWKIARVDVEMTLHDAAITRFGQWWRRQVRGGYGAMDVYSRFRMDGERLFARQTQSTIIWAVWWPAAVIVAGIVGLIVGGLEAGEIAAMILLLAMPLQIARLSAKAFMRGVRPRTALAYGALTMVSKWAWFQGQMQYRRDRMRGVRSRSIEYKQPAPQPVKVAQ
jgi:glycosyltransferase involved in cell wall biosynthesis/GT2 family glycosyltransferase